MMKIKLEIDKVIKLTENESYCEVKKFTPFIVKRLTLCSFSVFVALTSWLNCHYLTFVSQPPNKTKVWKFNGVAQAWAKLGKVLLQ